uniref:Kinesin motor domain-containing protein n=1 Tax=Loa loa TaxID=7209 RepID=A0A1I7VCZ1_LOALO
KSKVISVLMPDVIRALRIAVNIGNARKRTMTTITPPNIFIIHLTLFCAKKHTTIWRLCLAIMATSHITVKAKN